MITQRLVSRRASLLLGWLALVGMLMAAVVPGAARMRGGDATAVLLELCSSARGPSAAITAGAFARPSLLVFATERLASEDGEAPAVHAAADCPYCLLHLPALPGATVLSLPDVLPPRLVPGAFLREAVTRHAWRPAQPRGPPASGFPTA